MINDERSATKISFASPLRQAATLVDHSQRFFRSVSGDQLTASTRFRLSISNAVYR